MKTHISQGKNRFEADVAELESKLQHALQPVAPREAFICNLRRQLENRPDEEVKETQFSPKNILVILVSLLGGVLIVIFGARGIRSLIQAIYRLDQENVSMPTNPA